MINVYFDMPHLEAYLEAAGANFNEVHLQNKISDFLEEAILHHVQEKKFMIMGANVLLENRGILKLLINLLLIVLLQLFLCFCREFESWDFS